MADIILKNPNSQDFKDKAKWEQFEYDRRITDWELHRGFERY